MAHEAELHVHEPAHTPASGTGVAVCDCGATVRVVNGKPVENWHTCPVCTPHLYDCIAKGPVA